MYYNNYFWGMDLIWWFIWIMLLVWIFAIPYDIPGQRNRKSTSLDILRNRFALGEITSEEFKEKKKFLENNPSK